MLEDRFPLLAPPEHPSMTWTSFDRYGRYRAVARAVGALSGESPRRAVDVGDGSGYLGAFAPRLGVVCVDLSSLADPLPGALRVQGDGLHLPMPDAAVDVAVSVDALEHVAPAARSRFLLELARVARRAVIVAAPFATPGVVSAEALVRHMALLMSGKPQDQLTEHDEHGLPNLPETLQVLEGAGFQIGVEGNGNLHDWVTAMLLKFQVTSRPSLAHLELVLDDLYNSLFTARNDVAPFYRHLIVADRAGQPTTVDRTLVPVDTGGLWTAIASSVLEQALRSDVSDVSARLVRTVDDGVDLLRANLTAIHDQVISAHSRLSALDQRIDQGFAMVHGDSVGIHHEAVSSTAAALRVIQGTTELGTSISALVERNRLLDEELRQINERLELVTVGRQPWRRLRSAAASIRRRLPR